MTRFLKLYLPLFCWSGLIYYLSSIPNLRIEQLGLLDLIFRKIAHFLEFGILSILMYRAIEQIIFENCFWSVFITFIYSVLDEFHQYFVPGRFSDLKDVLLDTFGAVFLLIIYLKTIK